MLAVGRKEVAALNEAARAELRRSGLLGPDVLEADGCGYAVGDRVVCLRNDRRLDVLNGTTGTLARRAVAGVTISTTDGVRFLPATYLEAGHLGHAYALTVHKAQGLTVERAFVLATESLTKEAGYVALSRARQGTDLFVALGPGVDEAGHDPRPREQDHRNDLARRLTASRAKQLATVELEYTSSAAGRASAPSGGHPSDPSQLAPRERGRSRVYREMPRIGAGSGSPGHDHTTDEAEPSRRQRSLDDAMTLARETRERIEAERSGPERSRPGLERDRSWGRGL
jgi:hypothetical protein